MTDLMSRKPGRRPSWRLFGWRFSEMEIVVVAIAVAVTVMLSAGGGSGAGY